jgi:TP901 family phage tail tape measure protein
MGVEKTSLMIEVDSSGVRQGKKDLNSFTHAGAKAEKTTKGFGTTTSKTSQILDKFLGKNNKISQFLGGSGNSAVSKFLGGMSKLGGAVTAVTGAIAAMIALKVIQWLLSAANAAAKFSDRLANIGTLIPDQTGKLQGYGKAITEMSVDSGKSLEDLSTGTYQVISAFGDLDNSLDLLQISTNAAKAGLATTADSINLLSSVSKGYGDTSSEMIQHIADLSFETVRLGQTTFPELAASMDQAVPIAASLGISMEELYAITATLTGVTGSTSEVMTQQRGAMVALMKPTEDLKKLYKEVGVQGGKEFIEMNGGLVESLVMIQKTAEVNGQELTQYMGRVEGVTAALALTGPQMDTFIMKSGEMADVTGAANTALRQITDGEGRFSDWLKKLKSGWDALIVSIGDVFLPIIGTLAKIVIPVLVLLRKAFTLVGAAVEYIIVALTPAIDLFLALSSIFTGLGGGIMETVTSLFQSLANIIYAMYVIIKDNVTTALNTLKNQFEYIIKPLGDVWEKLTNLNSEFDATRLVMQAFSIAMFVVSTAGDALFTSIVTIIDSLKVLAIAANDGGAVLEALFDVKNWGTGAITEAFDTQKENLKNGLYDIGQDLGEFADRTSERWNLLVSQLTTPIEIGSISSGGMNIKGITYDTDALTWAVANLGTAAKQSGTVFKEIYSSLMAGDRIIVANKEAMAKLGIEYDTVAAQQKLYDDGLEKLRNTVGVTSADIIAFTEVFESLNILPKTEEVSNLTVAIEQLVSSLASIAWDASLGAFHDFGFALAEGKSGVDSLEDSLLNMGNSILQMLPMLLLQAGLMLMTPATWPIGLGLIAASGIVSIGAGYADYAMSKNATGNVYDSRNIIPFASGGAFTNSIVDKPTLFPFANGTGLMGEAGPEAIMPLTRTADGKLGVTAEGAGSNIEINIINNTSEKAEVKRTTSDGGKQIYSIIIGSVKQGMATGEFDGDMRNNYGVNRRGIAG